MMPSTLITTGHETRTTRAPSLRSAATGRTTPPAAPCMRTCGRREGLPRRLAKPADGGRSRCRVPRGRAVEEGSNQCKFAPESRLADPLPRIRAERRGGREARNARAKRRVRSVALPRTRPSLPPRDAADRRRPQFYGEGFCALHQTGACGQGKPGHVAPARYCLNIFSRRGHNPHGSTQRGPSGRPTLRAANARQRRGRRLRGRGVCMSVPARLRLAAQRRRSHPQTTGPPRTL